MLYPLADAVKIAIVGWHEGLAGQLHALLAQEGHAVDCFVNESMKELQIFRVPRAARQFSYPEGDSFKSLPLITSPQWVDILVQRGVTGVLLAVPDAHARQEAFKALETRLPIVSYVHPSVEMLPESHFGTGCLLFARALLGYRAKLGQAVIVNSGAQVDHHAVVDDFATLMPGVILCGNVHVERESTVGAGATILHHKMLGKKSFVGAGSVVLHDVPPASIVVGNPARFLRTIKEK